MKRKLKNKQQGAALVTLLIFTVVAMTIFSASVILMVENIRATAGLGRSEQAYYSAEAAAEDTILKFLRNRSLSESTTQTGNVNGTVDVNSAEDIIMTAEGSYESFTKIVVVESIISNDALSITSWKESQ